MIIYILLILFASTIGYGYSNIKGKNYGYRQDSSDFIKTTKDNRVDKISEDKIDFNLPAKNLNKLYLPVAIDGLRPGIGWRKKPVFNYIIVLDDYEYVPPMDFETWDTDYINYEIFRKVEPEQPTAEIEFKLIDKQKKLFRTIDLATESFNVTYDFKTGRWS